jgi:hypothetical protein
MSGIDFIRNMVGAFDYCNENFISQYSPEELIAIRKAWIACEWDIMPDQWTVRQVEDAIHEGKVPRFDDDGEPIE